MEAGRVASTPPPGSGAAIRPVKATAADGLPTSEHGCRAIARAKVGLPYGGNPGARAASAFVRPLLQPHLSCNSACQGRSALRRKSRGASGLRVRETTATAARLNCGWCHRSWYRPPGRFDYDSASSSSFHGSSRPVELRLVSPKLVPPTRTFRLRLGIELEFSRIKQGSTSRPTPTGRRCRLPATTWRKPTAPSAPAGPDTRPRPGTWCTSEGSSRDPSGGSLGGQCWGVGGLLPIPNSRAPCS